MNSLIGLDTETGGFCPAVHALLSVALVCDWTEPLVVYVTPESQPGKVVEPQAAQMNGYAPGLWADRGAVPLWDAMTRVRAWLAARKKERGRCRVVAHNVAFDQGFLAEAERCAGVNLGLMRYDWRCSMLLFEMVMEEGLVEMGSGSLDRLGEMSGAWLPGARGAVHDALQDAQGAVHGWRWLVEKRKTPEMTLRGLYETACAERRELERVLNGLMPFVLEDYFPNSVTPEFDEAVKAAAKAAGVDLAEVLKARGDGELAEMVAAVRGQWGPGKPRVLASEAAWREPLRWAKVARETGRRPRVFCASLADWLDDEVPVAWLVRLLELIQLTPEMDWLLLTKRPQNWERRMEAAWKESPTCLAKKWLAALRGGGKPPHNIWLGTTVENQAWADARVPLLLNIPAVVRFLSCEPLLGPVDLRDVRCMDALKGVHIYPESDPLGKIDWVICGGESGPGARPMHPDWARGLRDQCVESNVAFFFKQWGEFRPASPTDFDDAKALIGWVQIDGGTHQQDVPMHDADELMVKVGKKGAGRVLEGRTWDEMPGTTREPSNVNGQGMAMEGAAA